MTTLKILTPEELKLTGMNAQTAALVIYHVNQDPANEHLAWHVTVVPNLTSRYSYFIDAKTGEVLHFHSELCQLTNHLDHNGTCELDHRTDATLNSASFNSPPPPDGPYTANAVDLLGQSRLINTYSKNNVYFLIDASQTMYNSAQSAFPDDPVGVIWTISGQNTSPENNNFQAAHITSSNNSWNNPTAVSAHYHGEKAYDYFKNTFNRNSINGQGGNIISLINIVESDGSQMDNAFWNGAAMFYGNGNQAFTAPLAKALDVAGHEMSHGVIQTTANLEYQGESGALNESFADIFGAMIDRNDWKMGEDVVNTSIFSSGALRDLSDPHNGGSSLNDPGWQPAHYTERYTGNQDNGGVHINSGIPNKAYYLFANNGSVGKDKAELVYYRALTQYLVKSSKFVDCRIAVVQAATDLYGANSAVVTAAHTAFDAVGIGAGSGTNSQTDINSNPGDEYVLMSDDNYSQLYIFTPGGQEVFNPLTNVAPLTRPSITDDGSAIVYISDDNKMRAITINWSTGATNEQIIQSDPMWYNVAISKDGQHLAALTTNDDNEIWIYDFAQGGGWQVYNLYNPTTGQGAPTTGDVVFADVIEWDFTGEWVMYDAYNQINTTSGDNIHYWDIGFIRVWDNASDDFGDGFIGKLFNGLPENVSLGDPTFSKNSDYIIAFDYFDEYNDEYYLLAANTETGEVGTIYQNDQLSWPNYSVDDNKMVLDFSDNQGNPALGIIPIASDKLSPAGNVAAFITQGRWGVWFADGDRVLTDTKDAYRPEEKIALYPNPAGNHLTLDFAAEKAGEGQLQIFDLVGRAVYAKQLAVSEGDNHHSFSVETLPAGQYFLRLHFNDGEVAVKFFKQ